MGGRHQGDEFSNLPLGRVASLCAGSLFDLRPLRSFLAGSERGRDLSRYDLNPGRALFVAGCQADAEREGAEQR